MNRKKDVSLRSMFHILGNKIYLCLLGAGVIKEGLQDALNQNTLPKEVEKDMKKILEGLERIEKASTQAEDILKQIKTIVYKKLDPDQTNVEYE